jgi:hypothetical protein
LLRIRWGLVGQFLQLRVGEPVVLSVQLVRDSIRCLIDARKVRLGPMPDIVIKEECVTRLPGSENFGGVVDLIFRDAPPRDFLAFLSPRKPDFVPVLLVKSDSPISVRTRQEREGAGVAADLIQRNPAVDADAGSQVPIESILVVEAGIRLLDAGLEDGLVREWLHGAA